MLSGKDICQELHIYKSKLSYHTTQLRDAGFIKETANEGTKFWELTDSGKAYAVQNFSVGLGIPAIGLHNIAFKFKIPQNASFRLKETVTLRGWTKYQCSFQGYHVEKTTKHLIVYPIKSDERLWGQDARQLRDQARDKAIEIANEFSRRFNIVLGEPEVSRRPHYGHTSPIAIALQSKGVQFTNEVGGNDDSMGKSGEMDYFTEDVADATIRMPQMIAEMAERQRVLEDQMVRYGKYMEAHTDFIRKSQHIMTRLDAVMSRPVHTIQKTLKKSLSQRRLSDYGR